MMLANHTSRYHVAAAAVRGGAKFNSKVAAVAEMRAEKYLEMAQKDKDYSYANGKDPDGMFDTPVFD
jgi:xylulose-5-phosphate/fructose-6-phosphate phosphoketolase